MMKNIFKKILILLCFFTFIFNVSATSNKTTLKDLKDKLAEDQAKVNSINSQKSKVEKEIKAMETDLAKYASEIEQCEKDIEESKNKIEELNEEIENKQGEIDNLVSFKQLSGEDNVYLEYIFGASSFTDFIYRASVVEQLTKYNDELIDEMNNLIDENKQKQKDLNEQIEKSESTIDKLNEKLKSSNLTMDDLVDDHKDAKADLEASKKEVEAYEKLYKQYNCKETTSIIDCINIPYANGFTRPVTRGYMSSNYGMRYHPTLHYYRMHNGVDIGVPTGTSVYASAAGIVSKITRVSNPNKKNSSCGGNMVYIKHRVNGKEYTTVYMHLHTIKVSLNDYVTLNTIIGTSGGGESYDYCTTGPHLHFGIMYGSSYTDPRNYVNFPAKGKSFFSRWS